MSKKRKVSLSHLPKAVVWVEEESGRFVEGILVDEHRNPLTYSTNVSVKEILWSIRTCRPSIKTMKVMILNNSKYVNVSIDKIYESCDVSSTTSLLESKLADVLSAPTNLPSLVNDLRSKSENGITLVQAGPVYLSMNPGHVTTGGDKSSELNINLQLLANDALNSIRSGNCASFIISGCSGSG